MTTFRHRTLTALSVIALLSGVACKGPESDSKFSSDTTARSQRNGGGDSDSGSASSGETADGDDGGSDDEAGGGSSGSASRNELPPERSAPPSPATAFTTTTTPPSAAPVQDGPIVFADGPNSDLYLVQGDGSGKQPLGFAGHYPSWSPDKRRFVYQGVVPQFPKTRLFVFSLAERSVAPVGEFSDPAFPAWSPDGMRIAFIDRTAKCLRVVRTDGTGARCLSLGDQVPEFVSWSPSGGRLLFTQAHEGKWSTYSLDGKDFDNRRLEVSDSLYADVRADGRFAFIRIGAESRHELWLAEAGGANARRVKSDVAVVQTPKWSATGKQFVAVITHRAGDNRLMVFPDTGATSRDLGPCVDVADW